MPDEITPHATPIAPVGEPTWYPPAQDDDRAAAPQPSGVRYVFFGTDGLRAGWSLLIFVAAFAALTVAFMGALVAVGALHKSRHAAAIVEQRGTAVILGEGAQFAAAALAALGMAYLEKRRFAAYGLGSFLRRGGQFVGGWLLGAVTLSALVAVLWWRGLLQLNGLTMRGAPIVEWGFVWFLAFLMVGLFEEYLSRGYVQYTLTRGFAGIAGALGVGERNRQAVGFWLAALLMSFLFGLGHKTNPGESPVGIASAGLIGLLFAFTLWRTGSLWFAVGWHAAWDWAESYLWSVPDSGTMVQHHLTNATPQGAVLWSGGLTGPEGSWLVLPTIAISAVLFAVLLKPEAGSPAAEFARGEL